MKLHLTISFLIFCRFITSGQNLSLDENFLKLRAKYEVKQLGEFFDRFNMRDTFFIQDTAFKPSRYTNVLSLFNRNSRTSFFKDSAIQFAQNVIDSSFFLNVEDSDWYATAHAIFLYHGAKRNVYLTLQHIKNAGKGFSWVLVGANIDGLGLKLNRAKFKDIGPVNNELSFLDLSKAFDLKKDLLSYTKPNYSPDYVSILLYLIESGAITFSQITDVTYHFLNFSQWIFTVDNFNRMDLNSGWLISSVSINGKEQKDNYKKMILHL